MFKLMTLEEIFSKNVFRIPDYQRGYAWRENQLEDFWNDLININGERDHYTGVLTVKENPSVLRSSELSWLVNDRNYSLYYVIDGQQRLITSIILIKSIFETLKSKVDKDEEEILLNFEAISSHTKTFLYEEKPGDIITSYKFGYHEDNPSHEYFIYEILGASNPGTIDETFYTLNLKNAKKYFDSQVKEVLEGENGQEEIESLFKSLTNNLKFNFYSIGDDFDQFVAFETMNNRGRKLSNLELLKNRLIYLTTLYSENELPTDERSNIRNDINESWREVYHQLGRNKQHPLNDDSFLRAHWIMYFTFTKKRGDDYIDYLLNKKFTAQNVLNKKAVEVELENFEELGDDEDEMRIEVDESSQTKMKAELPQKEIKYYVDSLKASSKKWFQTFFPVFDHEESELTKWIKKLNYMGVFHFRPLIMSILLDDRSREKEKVQTLKVIERYIFLVFRINKAYSNYGQSEYSNFSRKIYRKSKSLADLRKNLNRDINSIFENGNLYSQKLHETIRDRYDSRRGDGFYSWPGLNYFLYEYEQSLIHEGRNKKLNWEKLNKSARNKITIEHIYPQNATDKYWQERFDHISWVNENKIQHSLGNLLPLSKRINSSLQNISFDKKKSTLVDDENNVKRSGYENGSWSEREVSHYSEWNSEAIKDRGIKMLNFMEDRWRIDLGTEEDKLKILHLSFLD